MIRKCNVLVFGDSLVYGLGDNKQGGWVNRLRLKLEKREDYFYDVYNLGIPDDTSENVLKRFKQEIKYRYYQGELVLIFLVGANDSSQTKIKINRFKKNIIKIIRFSKTKTNKIIFVSIPHTTNVMVEGRKGKIAQVSDEKMGKFNEIILQVCKEKQIDFINIRDSLTTKDTVDGIHFNSSGYEYISNAIYKEIVKEYI